MTPRKRSSRLRMLDYYSMGKEFLSDPVYLDGLDKTGKERTKRPSRTDIINFLLSLRKGETRYLEIGVFNPDYNFNRIEATVKYGVDPGVDGPMNPVDFRMTSDEFFLKLSKGEVLSNDILFDVIFIDGLHLAPQVDRDVRNALRHMADDGFIVLHDCNPPTEWHARESFRYRHTPAGKAWNGTTWKAFLKWRSTPSLFSCCIDTDWGVGVLSKTHPIGDPIDFLNPFFEYRQLDENRKEYLNLVDFETFKKSVWEASPM